MNKESIDISWYEQPHPETNVGWMLGRRLRRRPNIEQTLGNDDSANLSPVSHQLMPCVKRRPSPVTYINYCPGNYA